MKQLLFLILLAAVFACEDEVEQTIDTEAEQNKSDENSNHEFICYFPPIPSFPGGEKALINFIQSNIEYPPHCVEGSVFIEFIVNEDGSASDEKILKGLCEPCDKNALALISKMPKWIPAETSGERFKTKWVLPVKFKLNH